MAYRDCKLYVGNLSSGATRADLEKEFGYYGHLANVWVARSPPGFAYVEFEDARDAKDAVRGLDAKSYMGRKLRVEVAHGMQRSRGGGGGGRGGGGGGGGWGGPQGGPHDRNDRRRPFDPNDRCYNCGEGGHYAYDCALYRRRSSRRSSRSRSRSPRGRRSRTRSRSRSDRRRRSPSRSPRRSYSRSKSRSPRRSPSHSPRRSASRSRSRSKSGSRKRSASPQRNGRSRSPSRSRSRSRSH